MPQTKNIDFTGFKYLFWWILKNKNLLKIKSNEEQQDQRGDDNKNSNRQKKALFVIFKVLAFFIFVIQNVWHKHKSKRTKAFKLLFSALFLLFCRLHLLVFVIYQGAFFKYLSLALLPFTPFGFRYFQFCHTMKRNKRITKL